MMSLTFGLFTQVSGSGPLGPLVKEDISLFTLTYLLVGKAFNMFLVCKSKFKS